MSAFLRPTVLFFIAYAVSVVFHELSHAVAARLQDIAATLFHFYVNIDLEAASVRDRVAIALAGPFFSLVSGVGWWLVYRAFPDRPVSLLYLYLATVGISIFLGNLTSISFGGDFNRAAVLFDLPRPALLSLSSIGGISVAAFLYRMGGELVKFSSPGTGRIHGALQMILIPVALGAALVVLIFWPLPPWFLADLIGTNFLWLFAAAGAFVNALRVVRHGARVLQAADIIAAVAVVLIVRRLTTGIALSH